MSETLPILYQDEHLVAINKPSGLLVHRSAIDKRETRFAMQIVRDQVGQHVYTVHRLDRPTSGVLLMGLSKTIAQRIGAIMEARKVSKQYLAICRGHLAESGHVDYPLTEKLDKIADRNASKVPEAKEAETSFTRLDIATLDTEINKFPTSRFSLVRLFPKHGRKHQIRRHLSHLRHPIIGDINYGDNKYNNYFRQHAEHSRLALHAECLELPHPVTGELLSIKAPLDQSFINMAQVAELDLTTIENPHTYE